MAFPTFEDEEPNPRDALTKHFSALGFVPTCPLCGSAQWSVERLVMTPTVQGGVAVPMVPMVCDRCGTVQLIAWARVKRGLNRGG